MSDTVNVTFRMERDIKESADNLFRDLGMSLSVAFSVFVRQALLHGGLPFMVSDPFYSPENQKRLAQSIADIKAGKVTEHELIED